MKTKRSRPFAQNFVIALALLLALVIAGFSVRRLADTMAPDSRHSATLETAAPPASVAEKPAPAVAPPPLPMLEVSPAYAPVAAMPPAGGRPARPRGLRKGKAPPSPKPLP